jgi:hypothetical protein
MRHVWQARAPPYQDIPEVERIVASRISSL